MFAEERVVTKVGIPRALLYYQYYPMWKAFFADLGAAIVVSDPTTKATLAAGSARLVSETCLPVKVYCGHVLELVGRVDCVLVPAVRSLEPRVLNCSKFLGLPDVVRAVLPEAPPLLAPEIDLDRRSSADRDSRHVPAGSRISPRALRSFHREIARVGRRFTRDAARIQAAVERAWAAHLAYQRLMQQGRTPPEAIALWERSGAASVAGAQGAGSGATHVIALIGHPYNLYDDYITHNLLSRLRSLDIRVVTPGMASPEALRQGILDLTGQPYWTYEDEVVGAAGHYLGQPGIDGLIAVGSFGCGPDSTLIDVVRRAARERGRPFMNLIIDEHTGEAGLVTRLEAFVDMLARRGRAGRPDPPSLRAPRAGVVWTGDSDAVACERPCGGTR
jgi:predicted nucleotide-binding protein (sugar kinase/HSP70/actin superfamily)